MGIAASSPANSRRPIETAIAHQAVSGALARWDFEQIFPLLDDGGAPFAVAQTSSTSPSTPPS
jgi:hypothetical protein